MLCSYSPIALMFFAGLASLLFGLAVGLWVTSVAIDGTTIVEVGAQVSPVDGDDVVVERQVIELLAVPSPERLARAFVRGEAGNLPSVTDPAASRKMRGMRLAGLKWRCRTISSAIRWTADRSSWRSRRRGSRSTARAPGRASTRRPWRAASFQITTVRSVGVPVAPSSYAEVISVPCRPPGP